MSLRIDPTELDEIIKATARGERGADEPTPKSYDLNPYDLDTLTSSAGGYLSGDTHQGTATGLSYAALRALSRVPLISAIIQTRINQIAEFARPQPDRYTPGFVLRRRDGAEVDERTRAQMDALTRWLMTCGDSNLIGVTTFEALIRQVTRDSLVFDQACFEVIYDPSNGLPAAIKPVDSSTIRRAAVSEAERLSGRRDPARAAYVQVIDGRIVAHFTAQEMAWGIRRPRAELAANGYGFPELEEASSTIIDIVHSKAYNSANFTHGLHLSGILAVKSKMSPALFRAFRREFYSMLQGPAGAKKTPIIQLDPEQKEEISSVSLSNTNRDMEFSSWLNFLIKEVCALYQLDPAEIGYLFGNEGQTNSLNSAGPGERILHSREKGLRPTLRALETWLNRWVIHPFSRELELCFVGIEADSEERRIKATVDKVKSFMTVNEARATFDLPPLEKGGDVILDSSWINANAGGAGEGAAGDDTGEEDIDPADYFERAISVKTRF